jgi:hypothetical protein
VILARLALRERRLSGLGVAAGRGHRIHHTFALGAARDLSVALGLAQSRTDVSGSLSVAMTPAMSAFGAVGRTISKQDVNSATLSLSCGIAYSFQAWR